MMRSFFSFVLECSLSLAKTSEVITEGTKRWTLSLIVSLGRLNASVDPGDYLTVCVTRDATRYVPLERSY